MVPDSDTIGALVQNPLGPNILNTSGGFPRREIESICACLMTGVSRVRAAGAAYNQASIILGWLQRGQKAGGDTYVTSALGGGGRDPPKSRQSKAKVDRDR